MCSAELTGDGVALWSSSGQEIMPWLKRSSVAPRVAVPSVSSSLIEHGWKALRNCLNGSGTGVGSVPSSCVVLTEPNLRFAGEVDLRPLVKERQLLELRLGEFMTGSRLALAGQLCWKDKRSRRACSIRDCVHQRVG